MVILPKVGQAVYYQSRHDHKTVLHGKIVKVHCSTAVDVSVVGLDGRTEIVEMVYVYHPEEAEIGPESIDAAMCWLIHEGKQRH